MRSGIERISCRQAEAVDLKPTVPSVRDNALPKKNRIAQTSG
jgi:hypothetical protein